MIETSGAMSGGGGRPLSGRMATDLQKARRKSAALVTPVHTEASVAKNERELATKEANLTAFRQRRETLDDTVNQLTHKINETQRTVAKCQVGNFHYPLPKYVVCHPSRDSMEYYARL